MAVPLVVVHPSAKSSARRVTVSAADKIFARRLFLTLASLLGVLVSLLGIWAARTALIITYVSALIAIGLLPFVRRLEHSNADDRRRQLPRWIVVGAVYSVFLAAVALMTVLVVPPLLTQVGELRYSLPDLIARSQAGLVRHGLLSRAITIEDAVHLTPGVGNPNSVATEAGAVLGVVGGAFGAVTILVMTFYFLIEGPRMFAYLTGFVPVTHRPHVIAIARDVTGRVSAWLKGNMILGAIMGGATAVGLGLLGEPYFFIVALVAALAEMVPMAGPILAGLFAVALAFTVSVKLALSVAVMFFVLHELEANVLVPKVMARQVGLSSLAIFIALLVGGEWFGLVGVVLAIPTMGIVAATVEELRS